MLYIFSLLLIAFAVSVDGFGVGVMYGLRKIQIPLRSIIIIAICTGMMITISMLAGLWLQMLILPYDARMIGAIILVSVGIGALVQTLRKPMDADHDQSGTISSSEAWLLGAALSLDAFGAGVGASLVGLSIWHTSILITVASGMFIFVGIRIGKLFARWRWVRSMTFLPGIALIMIGLSKFL